MPYDPVRQHRKSIRLKNYDYASEGAYFVTICTKNRERLLNADPVRQLVQRTWHLLPDRFPNVRLDEFVIMPNHIHGIIWIVGALLAAPCLKCDVPIGNAPREGAASSAPTTLGRVVRVFKSISAIAINRCMGRAWNPIWQRNYYERIIRNENELNKIRQYIRNNPKNWESDSENKN